MRKIVFEGRLTTDQKLFFATEFADLARVTVKDSNCLEIMDVKGEVYEFNGPNVVESTIKSFNAGKHWAQDTSIKLIKN